MESSLYLPRVAVIRVDRAGDQGLAIQVLEVDPHGDRDVVLGVVQSPAELCGVLVRWLERLAADREAARETAP